ncbi:MAG: hypothetical protein KC416_16725, partial [Myxococcales bacterium]|nr:hypothetical protein [Myxococcales bacterium]
LRDFRLASAYQLLGRAPLPASGLLNTRVTIAGASAKPTFHIEGSYEQGKVRTVEGITAAYVIDLAPDAVVVDAQLAVADRGSLTLSGNILVDSETESLLQAVWDGIFDLRLTVDQTDLSILWDATGTPPAQGIRGHVSGNWVIAGAVFAPELDGTFSVPDLDLDGWPSLQVTSRLNYKDSYLVARVGAKDSFGDLAEVEGALLVDLTHLLTETGDAIASLESLPWRVAAKVMHRRLGDFPAPLLAHVPMEAHDMELGLSATFAGGALPTRGDVIASVSWTPPLEASYRCQEAKPFHAFVTASLENGETNAHVQAATGDVALIQMDLHAPTPLDEWLLAQKWPQVPPVQAHLSMPSLPLGEMPVLCAYTAGDLAVEMDLTDLFTDHTTGYLEVISESIQIEDYQPARISSRVELFDGEISGQSLVGWWSGQQATIW